jgi:hypothetical protein
MFIDPEMLDQWFKGGSEYGSPIGFGSFDKRVLLSLEQAAWEVSRATGESIPSEALTNMAARGWIPLLSHEDNPEAEPGVPLYVPSRIEFLFALERQGYSADELRVIAESEEQTIDYILTTDELTYTDDDLGIIIQHMECILRDTEKDGRSSVTVDWSSRIVTRERYERTFCMFQRFQHEGIPGRYQDAIVRDAFRIRALNECIRVWLCEQDRAKTRAGYSPNVFCVKESWHMNDGITFTAEDGYAGSRPFRVR